MNTNLDLICGQTQTLDLETPIPSLNSVLKIQGYKDLSKVRAVIQKSAQHAIEAFIKTTTPTVSYRIVDVNSVAEKAAVLGDDIRLQSSIFYQYLNSCHQAIVFVLTVGSSIDEQTEKWMDEENLIEALFLESAAWMGIEDATKQFVLIVRNWAMKNGMRISRRLGPGYSYPIDGKQVQWDLTDQAPLFKLLDDDSIPVKLLESSAMLPKMSRSGLFGLISN